MVSESVEERRDIRTVRPARNQLASLQEARYATGRSWACSVRKQPGSRGRVYIEDPIEMSAGQNLNDV